MSRVRTWIRHGLDDEGGSQPATSELSEGVTGSGGGCDYRGRRRAVWVSSLLGGVDGVGVRYLRHHRGAAGAGRERPGRVGHRRGSRQRGTLGALPARRTAGRGARRPAAPTPRLGRHRPRAGRGARRDTAARRTGPADPAGAARPRRDARSVVAGQRCRPPVLPAPAGPPCRVVPGQRAAAAERRRGPDLRPRPGGCAGGGARGAGRRAGRRGQLPDLRCAHRVDPHRRACP